MILHAFASKETGTMAKPAATTLLAWTRLLRAADLASQHCANTLRGAGLPPPEWYDVLLTLERVGPQRPRDLQAALATEQYALSRLLDLTEAGRAMRAAMWPVYAEAIEAALGARVDDESRAALAGLLAPLAERVDA